MAWYLVKHRENFTFFYLYLMHMNICFLSTVFLINNNLQITFSNTK